MISPMEFMQLSVPTERQDWEALIPPPQLVSNHPLVARMRALHRYLKLHY